MAAGLDLLEHLPDDSIRPDEVGAAGHAHVFLAEERLLVPHAVGLKHFFFRVGEQREVELVLLLELGLGLGLVGGAAEDDGVLAGKVVEGVTKLVRLGGSAWCHRLGEEPQNDALALEVGEAHGRAVVGRQPEPRRLRSFLQQHLRLRAVVAASLPRHGADRQECLSY